MATITDLLDEARTVRIADDLSGDEALEVLRSLVTLRNLADHLAATMTGVLEQCGVAKSQGRTLHALLMSVGCAPGVATRWIRTGRALGGLPTLVAHCADGAISGEHVDAIVKGIHHIGARAPNPIDDEARFGQVTDLVGQFFSGATPADIGKHARTVGNRIAGAQGGLPAGEDQSINTVDVVVTADGRVQVRADLDGEVGAKLMAAMEHGSAPRPEPDGSPDLRTASRRRADALEIILDAAVRSVGEVASAPMTQLLVTVPADTPDLATLEYLGPISRASVDRIACDGTLTTIIIDSERVPLDVGRDKRLFPPHLRKALYLRDEGCIKCGARPGVPMPITSGIGATTAKHPWTTGACCVRRVTPTSITTVGTWSSVSTAIPGSSHRPRSTPTADRYRPTTAAPCDSIPPRPENCTAP